MALTWFDRKKQETGEWTGFLAAGVRFEGKLEATGMFRVDAMVKGSLSSDEMLVLGEHSAMQGEIRGNRVRVGGQFDGRIQARARVDIQTNAVVKGDIHTPCLVIESGAIFDGNCHMVDPAQPAKPMTIPIRSAVAKPADAKAGEAKPTEAKPVET